jgi:hypothetical protein
VFFVRGEKMIKRDDGFNMVDFAARYQKGFRNNIIPVGQVPESIDRYGMYECYTTYFLFTKELDEYKKKTSSVSGFGGLVRANYLPLDIDAIDIGIAQGTAVKLVKLMVEHHGLDQKAVLIYFSGKAGYHIMIDTRVFGDVKQSECLHIVFGKIRERLTEQAKAKRDTVDLCIKDKLRLFRLPNTINRKSGLFKIQLTLQDLFGLTPSQIMDKARKAQRIFLTDRTGLLPLEKDIEPCKKLQELYREVMEGMKNNKLKSFRVEQGRTVPGQSVIDALCQAEQAIAQSKVPEGLRNNSALRLVSRLREKGFSRKATWEFIREWNTKCGIRLPGNELVSLVRSVYASKRGYSYGCNDEILKRFCPYKWRRINCRDYRIHQIKTITE